LGHSTEGAISIRSRAAFEGRISPELIEGVALPQRSHEILERNAISLTAEDTSILQLVVDSIDQGGHPLDPFTRRRHVAMSDDSTEYEADG
jgi:hypothetical protein